MKKIITIIIVLICMAAFLPAAFAGDTENRRLWFQPTLRTGIAFDAEPATYTFSSSTNFLGYSKAELELDSVARPYLALELPFFVTDRLTVSLKGDWSFTSSDSLGDRVLYTNTVGTTIVDRVYETDGMAHWVSAELLVSYALIKDRPIIKDLSIVGGVRWDYLNMKFDNPYGVVTSSVDWLHFEMQTLAPVLGINGTFNGFKKGIWGGDMHLSFLGGPIVWGDQSYKERINNVNTLVYKGDQSPGYILKLYGDVTILSGKIIPTMEGSLAFFAQFTKTDINGTVDCKDLSQPFVPAHEFDFDGGGTVGVFGLSGSILF